MSAGSPTFARPQASERADLCAIYCGLSVDARAWDASTRRRSLRGWRRSHPPQNPPWLACRSGPREAHCPVAPTLFYHELALLLARTGEPGLVLSAEGLRWPNRRRLPRHQSYGSAPRWASPLSP